MLGTTSTLILIVLSSLCVAIYSWIFHRKRCHRILEKYGIPGPPPNFLDGNLKEYKKERTPYGTIESWLKKYGNVFGYYMGEVPYIVVKDIEIIKQILIKDFSNFINRSDLYMNIHPFEKTMLGLKDQRWKDVRTIITPIFSTSKLKLLKEVFDKKVDITLKIVTKKAENKEMFDIYDLIQGLTLDVIASCALAMKTRCQENPKDELKIAMKDFQELGHSFAINYGVMFPFLNYIFTFLANNLTQHSGLNAIILNNLKEVIKIRRKNPNFKSMDILQLLLDNSDDGKGSKKLSTDEVIANAYITLLAGFETTSTALAFTFYLLVKHPDIQERLFKEIDKAPDSSYDTLQGLHYMDQVLNESMRILPPVTEFITRVCKEDRKIGGYTFPKKSVIQIPVWHLHHDPTLFPDPLKFDPDRFSGENKNFIRNTSYLAFGEGPRNCIGARFAFLEAKLTLFKLLKKFKFVSCEKSEEDVSLVCYAIVLNPANGVWVRAIPRDL